ncbi:hypothetical protein GF407_00025 [candidate division KSB1 bacterium]|nr:hypothetical protein [candidate division KSB1 bacterium]
MRIPQGYSREELCLKISTCFQARPEISFAYIFSPLDHTPYESYSDFDVAVQMPVYYDQNAILEEKLILTDELLFILPTENFTLVAFNDTSFAFQKIILNTGILIFNRHPRAHNCFVASLIRRHPELAKHLSRNNKAGVR